MQNAGQRLLLEVVHVLLDSLVGLALPLDVLREIDAHDGHTGFTAVRFQIIWNRCIAGFANRVKLRLVELTRL